MWAIYGLFGGLSFWLPADLALPEPGGGACLFGCLPTLPLASILPPNPPPPDPLPLRGRGRIKVFLCKGLRPLHPQHLTACGTYRACQAGTLWGACFPCRLPAFYFSLISFPHPPDPLPGGKGENQSLFRRGLPPPAPLQPGGKRHWICFWKTVLLAFRGKFSIAGKEFQAARFFPMPHGFKRIQNPQQKRLSRFCKTQNPSHHPVQQRNRRSGHQRKSSAK